MKTLDTDWRDFNDNEVAPVWIGKSSNSIPGSRRIHVIEAWGGLYLHPICRCTYCGTLRSHGEGVDLSGIEPEKD